MGRLAGAVIAMGIAGWVMLATSNNAPGEMGIFLFVALSIMLFIYSLGAGARITADCLSEEKREGTLGLLFLTDLKGYDIIAGKLAANSLNTFYGLLSAFPVLAISLLMGGVTVEFWKVTLVATNLLFFSLAVGIFASSVCRDERKATSLAFLVLIFVLGATPLMELSLNLADHNRPFTTTLLRPSPAFACFSAFGSRLSLKARDFWTPVVMTHLYAWFFLGIASVIVPRSWQDKAEQNRLPFRNFWRLIFQTNRVKETRRRTKLLERNPFLWLAAGDPIKIIFLWIVIFLLTALWIWGMITWPKEWMTPPVYVITAIALHTLLKVWITSEACYRFIQDRKTGAMELLLSTPLSVKEILRGQQLALFRQFAAPALFILAVDLIFLLLGLSDRDMRSSSQQVFWIMVWLAGMSVFVMDLLALSWVSMWEGMRSVKINRASGGAITRVLVLPWGVFALSITFWGAINIFAIIRWDEKAVLLYWLALCVANNFILMNWAKKNLRERFRDIATQRFDVKKSRLGWLKSRKETTMLEVPPVIHLR